jgi:hypothetical protein
MPEADVEIRHLLKTAQLSHPESAPLRIDVVLKNDDEASLRYERLFGRSINMICDRGIQEWVVKSLSSYCG